LDQEAIVTDALEDILTVYKDRMLPEEKEEETINFADTFEKIFSGHN